MAHIAGAFAVAKGAMQFKAVLDTLRTVTPLVGEARKWYESRGKNRVTKQPVDTTAVPDFQSLKAAVDGVRERLEQIETDDDSQAEIISGIVEQTEALAQGVQILARRVTLLVVLSGGALILGGLAVGLYITSQ